jgi:hypothetical protein
VPRVAVGLARQADRLGDAEVGDDGAAVGEQDVLRLHVAVHDAGAVRVGERARHVARDVHGVVDRERPLPLEPPAEALPLDERHRVVQHAALELAGREEGHDVRVLQPRGEADLALEPLRGEPLGEVGAEHLHDHLSPERGLVGDEDAAHPPATELPLDGVGRTERPLQPVVDVRRAHRVPGLVRASGPR